MGICVEGELGGEDAGEGGVGGVEGAADAGRGAVGADELADELGLGRVDHEVLSGGFQSDMQRHCSLNLILYST